MGIIDKLEARKSELEAMREAALSGSEESMADGQGQDDGSRDDVQSDPHVVSSDSDNEGPETLDSLAPKEGDNAEVLRQKLASLQGRLKKLENSRALQADAERNRAEADRNRTLLEQQIDMNRQLMLQLEELRSRPQDTPAPAQAPKNIPLTEDEQTMYANEIPVILKLIDAAFLERGITRQFLDGLVSKVGEAETKASRAHTLSAEQAHREKFAALRAMVPDLDDLQKHPAFSGFVAQEHRASTIASGKHTTVNDYLHRAFGVGDLNVVKAVYDAFRAEVGIAEPGQTAQPKGMSKAPISPGRGAPSIPSQPKPQAKMDVAAKLREVERLTRAGKHEQASKLMQEVMSYDRSLRA